MEEVNVFNKWYCQHRGMFQDIDVGNAIWISLKQYRQQNQKHASRIISNSEVTEQHWNQ